MGISIDYIPKNPSSLSEAQLIDLGVGSKSQRNSYLLAKRLAKLLRRRNFMEVRGFEGSYYIDIKLAQLIPYEWDRVSKRRKERMRASLALRSQGGVLHVILQPAGGHIHILDIKNEIRDFSRRITKYNRTTKGPKILISKFEVNCHFTGAGLAYLHCHVLIDSFNEWLFREAWAFFAGKEKLSAPAGQIKVIFNRDIAATINYLAKHPISIVCSGKNLPLFEPEAWKNLSDENLLDLQEMMWNTKFIWRKRVPKEKDETLPARIKIPKVQSNLNIRSPKRITYKEWLKQWSLDFERLKAHRSYIQPTSTEKDAFQRQKAAAQKHSHISFGTWTPKKYFSEIGLLLIHWPPP